MEAAVTEVVSRFEREHLGRGPKQARSYIIRDMILVRLTGILSAAERQLSEESGGTELLKQVRSRLIEGSSETIAALLFEVTGSHVISMHTDISCRTGERVFVFELEDDLEARLTDH